MDMVGGLVTELITNKKKSLLKNKVLGTDIIASIRQTK